MLSAKWCPFCLCLKFVDGMSPCPLCTPFYHSIFLETNACPYWTKIVCSRRPFGFFTCEYLSFIGALKFSEKRSDLDWMTILRDNWGWCGKSIARFRQIIWWLRLKLNGWFACFAVLRLRSHNPDQSSRYMVHGLQLTTQLCYKTLEFEKFLGLSELGEATECFRVVVSTLGSMICVCISLIITQGHLSAYRSSIIRSVILLTVLIGLVTLVAITGTSVLVHCL